MIKELENLKLVLIFTVVTIIAIPRSTHANLVFSQNNIGTPKDAREVEIYKAKEINLIPEKIQGEYRKNITREEFSELAVTLYEDLVSKQITYQQESPFVDTQNPKIVVANKLGIISGKENNMFSPNENITREQASLIIYRTLQVAKPKYNYSNLYEYEFEDYNLISPWAKKAVGYLYGTEIINQANDNKFNPKEYISRQEAIIFAKTVHDKVLASERTSRNGLTVSRGSIGRRENDLRIKLKSLIPKELGKPYKWGSIGPNSYDCSGLVYSLFKKLGIELPRASKSQASAGVYISKNNLEYGDLVFFARDGKNINHVGIYVGNGAFVHSPQSGDVVKITTLMSGYYRNSYYTARRVIPK